MLKKILAGGLAIIVAYILLKLIFVLFKVTAFFIFNIFYIGFFLGLAGILYVIFNKKLLK